MSTSKMSSPSLPKLIVKNGGSNPRRTINKMELIARVVHSAVYVDRETSRGIDPVIVRKRKNIIYWARCASSSGTFNVNRLERQII
jgi:hypothetical protein